MQQHADTAKHVVDGISFGLVVGVLAGWLPIIAAALACVLTGMRIVNEWPKFKATVKRWFKK